MLASSQNPDPEVGTPGEVSPRPDRRRAGVIGRKGCCGRSCLTHRDRAPALRAVGGVQARGRWGRGGGRSGCRGRDGGGRLPVFAGALGLGLDTTLVQGEGVLAFELQALGRHGLVAGLTGAVVAPAQLDAPAEALHDRAVPRQRELRHGAGGQHHGPRAARAGTGPLGAGWHLGLLRFWRPRSASRPRHVPAGGGAGSGAAAGLPPAPLGPTPGQRTPPASGLGLSPAPLPHCFPRRCRRHLKIVFGAFGRGRGLGRRTLRHC